MLSSSQRQSLEGLGSVSADRIVIVGAGVAGLAAALDLAARGLTVDVVERAAAPGGKMRQVEVAGVRMDAGPTVFTMRWVFDELFADAGTDFADHVPLKPAEILARHAWSADQRLDLYADVERSADAIGALAGLGASRGYRAFCARAREIYRTLEGPFIRADRPSPPGLVRGVGLGGLRELWRIRPFDSLWQALGDFFDDPRLRQLFGRYSTYCGSSPFAAPATLMLVAHVEQDGVWFVEGGMHSLAKALAGLAERHGARFHYRVGVEEVLTDGGRADGVLLSTGETLTADAVVLNADVGAVSSGLLGNAVRSAAPAVSQANRSLSAVTWNLFARTEGFPLLRHTVFFSQDYAAEFEDILVRAQVPSAPTVYVCAQDREDAMAPHPKGPERLLCLINAPAVGDSHPLSARETEQCAHRTFGLLERCGLQVERTPETTTVTTPEAFDRLFPGSGGALYGPVSHGWRASFGRAGSRTRIPGLYLAGGSVHPGPGVPMAALSGRLAARSLMADLTSRRPSRAMAMSGGTWTR